jgi:hypothetical protein
MRKPITNKEIVETISTLTTLLMDMTIDEPAELSVANHLLQAMTRNLKTELAAEDERLNLDPVQLKSALRDSKDSVLTPEVIKPEQFTMEVKKILNYIEFKSPSYMICFKNAVPTENTMYRTYLNQIIVIAYYGVLLNQETADNRDLSDFFSEDPEALRVFKSIKNSHLDFHFEADSLEDLTAVNASIVWLGYWTLRQKISASSDHIEKFRVILDIIDNNNASVQQLANHDLFSFIRLCIEATILCLNIYNKSIFIKKYANNNLKLKSIIINKLRKTRIDFPIIVFQDLSEIKLYLCISSQQVRTDRQTISVMEAIPRAQGSFMKASEGGRNDGPSNLVYRQRSATPIPTSGNNEFPTGQLNLAPSSTGNSKNYSFFQDQASRIEIEINDSKFQSSEKKQINNEEDEKDYSDKRPPMRRLKTETYGSEIDAEVQENTVKSQGTTHRLSNYGTVGAHPHHLSHKNGKHETSISQPRTTEIPISNIPTNTKENDLKNQKETNFMNKNPSFFTHLQDIVNKADGNTALVLQTLRPLATHFENIPKVISSNENSDQITVKRGFESQPGQVQRFIFSHNNSGPNEIRDIRRNLDFKTGVSGDQPNNQPRMTTALDGIGIKGNQLDLKTVIAVSDNEVKRRQTDFQNAYNNYSVKRNTEKEFTDPQQALPSSEFINHVDSKK